MMDFDLDGLVRSGSATAASNSVNGGFSFEHGGFGSGFLKRERGVNQNEFDFTRVAKNRSFCEGNQQMLSFSSSSQSHYQRPGAFSGMRFPFTPSQWMELEQQALFYKQIASNAPVTAGFPSTLGWGGAFHLGFSNSDPEPGRCRRTDGKKWRCSRDAVADQKYCERHINRGRHRSRKPVEGQSGHPKNSNNSKTAAIVTSTAPPSSGSEMLSLSNYNRSFAAADNQDYKSEAYGLKQFMDVWSKDNSEQTQLSMSISIPTMAASSATDFPFPSPKLQELEMGLGVGQTREKHATNWTSWEHSIAGPLGEVLHNTSSAAGDLFNCKPLNLMDGHGTSCSSPTGAVSTGSSPRTESCKTLSNGMLLSLPSL